MLLMYNVFYDIPLYKEVKFSNNREKGKEGTLLTLYERVKTIVVDKLGVDEAEVQEESSFVEDLKADSLDLVELIMALEEEFSTDDQKVEISDEEAGKLLTVRDAVEYIESLPAAQTASA